MAWIWNEDMKPEASLNVTQSLQHPGAHPSLLPIHESTSFTKSPGIDTTGKEKAWKRDEAFNGFGKDAKCCDLTIESKYNKI